jgi:hypothetical protein
MARCVGLMRGLWGYLSGSDQWNR